CIVVEIADEQHDGLVQLTFLEDIEREAEPGRDARARAELICPRAARRLRLQAWLRRSVDLEEALELPELGHRCSRRQRLIRGVGKEDQPGGAAAAAKPVERRSDARVRVPGD